MTVLHITPLSEPPSRNDPDNFIERSDTFLSEIGPFALEANALAEQLNDFNVQAQAAKNAAADSADSALESKNAAADYAGAALVSKNAAADSAAAANTSAVQASKLNLGAKASEPTADNQGAALLTGTTYYDTTLTKWRVWNGAAWVDGLSAVAGVSSINGESGPIAGVVKLTEAQNLTNKTITDPKIVLNSTDGEPGQALISRGSGLSPVWATSLEIVRVPRTSNTKLVISDRGKLIDIASGTFTQTFDATAALKSGWFVYIRNAGSGDITLDPSGSETIDGLSSYLMYPGEVRLIQCDGAELRTIVLNAFYKVFTASGTFVKPPGYQNFSGLLWGGGASGGNYTAGVSAGGGGGGCTPWTLHSSNFGSSETVTIAAGGLSVTGVSAGNPGGNSTLGSLVTGYGGGAGFTNGGGGGGGGVMGAGFAGTAGAGGGGGGAPVDGTDTKYNGGGVGGSSTAGQKSYWGGGGGGGYSTGVSYGGGSSIYGGGGGGGSGGGGGGATGGTSKVGGAGGNSGTTASVQNGQAPGGGGGASLSGTQSGAGARGELRIWGVI